MSEAVQASEKGNVGDDDSELPQKLSRVSLPSEAVADVVKYVPVNDFTLLDDNSELAVHDDSHVIDDSSAYYIAVFLTKLFLGKTTEICCCLTLLRDGTENLNRPHQYFMILMIFRANVFEALLRHQKQLLL